MKKKLSGWMESGIVGGVGIGMMAGLIVGWNFLIPYFEKRNKEEPKDN